MILLRRCENERLDLNRNEIYFLWSYHPLTCSLHANWTPALFWMPLSFERSFCGIPAEPLALDDADGILTNCLADSDSRGTVSAPGWFTDDPPGISQSVELHDGHLPSATKPPKSPTEPRFLAHSLKMVASHDQKRKVMRILWANRKTLSTSESITAITVNGSTTPDWANNNNGRRQHHRFLSFAKLKCRMFAIKYS